jgi:REP element-mobilizing transposase RayT
MDMRIRLRNEEPGRTWHVYSRGVDRRRIFVDDEDYRLYVALLGAAAERYGWRVLCFCLMPNHVHLLIETPEPTLGVGMQWLHSRYALAFNRRHSRTGHLFENRFRSPVVKTDEAFVRLVGYIVMNPVAASLCDDPVEWPWGSHALVSAERIPAWLAHAHLVDRLDEISSAQCYAELVRTARRVIAIDTGRRIGSEPLRRAA